MAEWRKKHPEAHWDDAVAQTHAPTNAGRATGADRDQTGRRRRRRRTSARHLRRLRRARRAGVGAETQKFIDEGNAIFHDAKQLGGTIAVSCDMCHPNAANTHPETYPKFQVQLGRVALLRDMINWCIENPVEGQAAARRRSQDARARGLHPRAAQRAQARLRQALVHQMRI